MRLKKGDVVKVLVHELKGDATYVVTVSEVYTGWIEFILPNSGGHYSTIDNNVLDVYNKKDNPEYYL